MTGKRTLTACLIAMLLLPLGLKAEVFNHPQFGRSTKQVTETLEYYDHKGTDNIDGKVSSAASTVVFTPANPGEAVQIVFSRIHLKGDGASFPVSLSVFNGEYNEPYDYPTSTGDVKATDFTTNDNELARYYSAADKTLIELENVTFTSTDPSGALSVNFLWKWAAKTEGWVATVKSVVLTDMSLAGVTADYSAVTPLIYPALPDVNLGSINIATEGNLNPFTLNTLSFDLTDTQGILENVRLLSGNTPLDIEPAINGTTYTYTLDTPLGAGDNKYTVKADIKADAPFHATAKMEFTSVTTSAPTTPAITGAEAPTLEVSPVVMMPTDGSHLVMTVADGEDVAFYDNGGPDKTYTIMTEGTVTFKPAEGSGKKVMIDFTALDLFKTNPAVNDEFVVYNGTEVDPDKVLIRLLTENKAIVRATGDDGALTVHFKTVTGVAKDGWKAVARLFEPAPMTLVGATQTLATSERLGAGDVDTPVVAVNIVTTNTEPPLTLDALSATVGDIPADWVNAKVYSSVKASAFDAATATLVGTAAVTGSDVTVTLTDPVTLTEGDNYFFLCADVAVSALDGGKISATVTSVTLSGTAADVEAPAETLEREVYNVAFLTLGCTTKTVFNSLNVRNKPYSDTYDGYEGLLNDVGITLVPAHEGSVVEIEFSKLNLYYYNGAWSSTTPTFYIYSGTEAEGDPIYTHTQDNNFRLTESNAKVGVIRSTSPDGALTIRLNAGTQYSSSTKETVYGVIGQAREYISKDMTAGEFTAFHTGETTVSAQNRNNVALLGTKVTTDGNLNPLPLNNITFTLNTPAPYAAVRLATTGRVATPAGATTLAEGTVDADGVVSFDLTDVKLGEGDNHFWLLADVKATAAPGTVLDATLTSATVNGTAATIAVADPEGSLTLVNTYDVIVANNEQVVEVGPYPIQVNGLCPAYYSNNYTLTAKPADPEGKVTAKFTEGHFNVNTSYQYLTVTGGVEPVAIDAETVYPVEVTSVREDGSLTIAYTSSTIATEGGWKCMLSSSARVPYAVTEATAAGAPTGKGTRTAEVLLAGVGVKIEGSKNPISLTQVKLAIPQFDDIFSGLHLYTSGTVGSFMRNDLMATSTSATIDVEDATAIDAEGTYYYWVAGVVKEDAALNAATTVAFESLTFTHDETATATDLSSLAALNFQVVKGFSGIHTVGSSAQAEYANLTTAVADMANGIDGPVEFVIEDGTYIERIDLDHIGGMSAANTVTFRGESGNPDDVHIVYNQWVDPGYVENREQLFYGVVTLRGCSHVAFEALTIRTTNVEMPSVVRLCDGTHDVTLTDCVLMAPVSTSTYDNISLVTSFVTENPASVNHDVTLSGCDLDGGYCGVYFGSSYVALPPSDGLTVENCYIHDQGFQGIYANRASGVNITDNLFEGVNTSSEKTYCQMVDLNVFGAGSVERNTLKYQQRGVYGLYFRGISATDDAPFVVANNVIDIDPVNCTGAAIQLYNGNKAPFKGFVIAHNSILTSRINNGAIAFPLIINVKEETEVDGRIANNIFHTTTGGYVIKEQYGPSGATYLHNVGYTSGTTYAYWGGSYDKEMTFAEWKVANDANAKHHEVAYDDTDELKHLLPAETSMNELKVGTPLAEVPADRLNTLRHAVTPTVGAYEAGEDSGINAAEITFTPALKGTYTASADLTLEVTPGDRVAINTLSGITLMQHTATGATLTLPVGDLPRGLHLLSVGTRTYRLILR